ncbi:MAG: hypothetical protein ABIT76_06580 [Chthoniobacterales bacterium]
MRKAPLFIRIISYFFIFMGIVAIGTLGVAGSNPSETQKMSVSFLTNSFSYNQNPTLFAATCLLFVFAGITGLAIVFRRSYAYDLGIVYCVCSLVFFTTLIILRVGLINHPAISITIQFLLFGGFLAYLIRNRSKWKNA